MQADNFLFMFSSPKNCLNLNWRTPLCEIRQFFLLNCSQLFKLGDTALYNL